MRISKRPAVIYVVAVIGLFILGYYSVPTLSAVKSYLFPPVQFELGDYSGIYSRAGVDVVIFTESTCPYCRKAIISLDRHGVKYRNYVIDEGEGLEEYAAIQGKVVPIILIRDRKITGYVEPVILESLALP